MINETIDIFNVGQVTVMRRVEDNLEVHDEYLGLYCVDSIGANSLSKRIKETFLHMNLSIKKTLWTKL